MRNRIDHTGALPIIIIMAIVAIVGWLLFAINGCAGLPKPKSVCDTLDPGASLLCDLATKNGVRLEDAGNMLVLFNVAAIEQGTYTAAQSKAFFEQLGMLLAADGITAVDVMRFVQSYLNASPTLAAASVMVVSPYLGYLETPEVFRPADKTMLNKWIDDNLSLLP